jgi:hypothetical protein
MDISDAMSFTSADSSRSALPDAAHRGKPWKGIASPAKILSARKFAQLAALRERTLDCSDDSDLEKQESESEAAEEAADHGHEHDTRHIADRRQAVAAARARKSEALGKLRSKFQEIMNVLYILYRGTL